MYNVKRRCAPIKWHKTFIIISFDSFVVNSKICLFICNDGFDFQFYLNRIWLMLITHFRSIFVRQPMLSSVYCCVQSLTFLVIFIPIFRTVIAFQKKNLLLLRFTKKKTKKRKNCFTINMEMEQPQNVCVRSSENQNRKGSVNQTATTTTKVLSIKFPL